MRTEEEFCSAWAFEVPLRKESFRVELGVDYVEAKEN